MRSADRAGVVCEDTIGRSGGVVESREALIPSELATNRAAIVDKRAVAAVALLLNIVAPSPNVT